MNNWDLYEARLTINGLTSRDRDIKETQDTFKKEAFNSPAHIPNITRNGVIQDFLITSTKATNRHNIIAFPKDALCVGDYIKDKNNTWLVTEIDSSNVIQKKGIITFCNCKFKFQNLSPDIIECYGVLDSNLSSNVESNNNVQYFEKSTRLYLPYNKDTQMIHEGKRIAVGTKFDSNGNKILETYTVIGRDSVTYNYGDNGCLLVLNCERCDYSKEKDNLSLMICDYISPEVEVPVDDSSLLPCSISGRSTMSIGTTKEYKVTFYRADKQTIAEGVQAVWFISPISDDIKLSQNDNLVKISVAARDELIGNTFTLSVKDVNGLYKTETRTVEVVYGG